LKEVSCRFESKGIRLMINYRISLDYEQRKMVGEFSGLLEIVNLISDT
jgi:hypothetical protein